MFNSSGFAALSQQSKMARRAERDEVTEQLLAIRQHIEIHHCADCRKLLHKLANSIQVTMFGKKANKAKPELDVSSR